MKVAETLHTTISYHHALVAQLDSVSASDAEGCGFDPRRVHQSPLFRGLLHLAGVRTHRSPDAEGGARAACGEVSPPGAPKPPFSGAFAFGRGENPSFARRRRRRTSRLRRSIPAGCTKAPFFGGFCIRQGSSPSFARRRRRCRPLPFFLSVNTIFAKKYIY